MTPAEEDRATANILAHQNEMNRLKQLSDLDLVRECICLSDVSDDPVVEELINRVRPGWLEEL